MPDEAPPVSIFIAFAAIPREVHSGNYTQSIYIAVMFFSALRTGPFPVLQRQFVLALEPISAFGTYLRRGVVSVALHERTSVLRTLVLQLQKETSGAGVRGLTSPHTCHPCEAQILDVYSVVFTGEFMRLFPLPVGPPVCDSLMQPRKF